MPINQRYRYALLAAVCLLAACQTPRTVTPSKTNDITPRQYETDGAPEQAVDLSHVTNAVPQYETRSKYGNPPFYEVYGQRYYVLNSALNYKQRGIASWYGRKFHGHLTSTREQYDMFAMTAAHKTLPIPCYAKVTNLENGRSIIVKINDRGPFHADRIIDLSYAAASKLDITNKGTGIVEVETIATEQPSDGKDDSAYQTAQLPTIYIQVGAFSDKQKAEQTRQLLEQHTNNIPVQIAELQRNELLLHRVRLGPIESVEQADLLVTKVGELNLGKPYLVVE